MSKESRIMDREWYQCSKCKLVVNHWYTGIFSQLRALCRKCFNHKIPLKKKGVRS